MGGPVVNKPLAIDLFCGLGGWTEGLLATGWDVVGFDIERHRYDGVPEYPAQLVLQDVLTLDGAQLKDADLIVASPPCQTYSYMAMPFGRSKALEQQYLNGEKSVDELNALFNACFCIQREASEAAGRHIPLIVENVRGANKWVGRSRWNFGSYHLWGDVPALMPVGGKFKIPGQNWSRYNKTGKVSPHWNQCGVKQHKSGRAWFSDPDSISGSTSSKSPARARASALIAKIPRVLSEHIGRVFYPDECIGVS